MISSPHKGGAHWRDLRPATEIGEKLLASTPLYNVGRVAEKLLALDQLDAIYSASHPTEDRSFFFENLLDRLNIVCHCPDEELARVPQTGPVVVVANHPFGLVEPPVLASLLARRRGDFRFLANNLLSDIELLQELCDPGDAVWRQRRPKKANFAGLRSAVEWLRKGGLMVVFPAGEVSSFRFPEFQIADPVWSETIGRIARITGATVVPVYFHGTNSPGFQLAGLIHPRLRTALLPRELLEKSGRTIAVSVGAPILPRAAALLSSGELTAYLRMRTELLQTRKLPRLSSALPHRRTQQRIGGARGAKSLIQADVRQLTPDSQFRELFCDAGGASPTPAHPAGTRPVAGTFLRATGEVNRSRARSGQIRSVVPDTCLFGIRNARKSRRHIVSEWSTQLFQNAVHGVFTPVHYSNSIPHSCPSSDRRSSWDVLSARPEYQRDYLPLLLLWKGICRFVAGNPRYRTLFGPVSISNDYHSISRALIIEFCKKRGVTRSLAVMSLSSARQRFHSPPLPGCDRLPICSLTHDVPALSALISDLEPDRKGVPVLLRQYLNLGGNVLEFNVDRQFSNAVDGLILVDLLKADRRSKRYMGWKR